MNFGHMLTGILLKLKPKELTVMPFGISIIFEDYGYKKLMEQKKILIALAGPFINFLIAILTLILPIGINTKEMVVYSNLLIGLFNLIPLYPLDGGRILKSLIRLKNNSMKTDYIVNKTSNVIMILLTGISSIAILYLKNIAIFFVIIYLWILVIKENRRYKLKEKMYRLINNQHL